MRGKAVLGLAALAGAGYMIAKGRKKNGGALSYDELKQKPTVRRVQAGDVLAIDLPGLSEQWGLEVVGPQVPLDEAVEIGKSADRGMVTYEIAFLQTDPWEGTVTFLLNGEPEVSLRVQFA